MKIIGKKVLFPVALMLGALAPFAALAQATISINPNLPGPYSVSVTGPCGWLVDFYYFALIISGILAFGGIVFGGIKYAISAGNPSKQHEGRSWIWSALIGLLLLGGAYLILHTVNPNLTTCTLPALSNYNIASNGGSQITGNNVAPGNCAGGPCQVIPSSICTPSANVNCGGAQGMINTLQCIQQQDPNFRVSEGYPPTVNHTSAGHNDGCSVDTTVANGCAGVAALQAAATQCGATSLNEYSNCGGKTYGTTTGSNVHINAQSGSGGC